MKGFAGKGLYVDLTEHKVRVVDLDEAYLSRFIGGRAMGAELLYQELPANADPFGPDNPIILLTGPITGTVTPGSGKLAVVTKSPVTGGFLDCYTSGMVAAELKYAGYDLVVITGVSDEPCILTIQDDRVAIEDGSPYWGRDAFEAEDKVVEKYGADSGRLVIGPAGENKVAFACVNSDYYRQLGRGGLGAVMGAKKLKAIVVKGTGSVGFADLEGMLQTSFKARELAKQSETVQTRIKTGTPMTMNVTHDTGTLPTKNFQRGTFEEGLGEIDGDGMIKAAAGTRACLGCLSACGKIVKIEKNGIYLEGPEYETSCMFGSNLLISDVQKVSEANLLCDRLGLDTVSAGNCVGFVMECAEKGLLKDYNLTLKFGSLEGVLELIEDMAYRRGLGEILAEGVRDAAKKIGGGSEHFAIHVRGMELPAYDPRSMIGNALSYTVTARGGCHRRSWPPLEVFIGLDPLSYEKKAAYVKGNFDGQCILHSFVACDFHSSGLPFSIEEYIGYLKCVTGKEYTMEQLMQLAERAETLIRMLNVREGSIPEQETMPGRFFDDPIPDGPAKGHSVDRNSFREMLEEYYELRGWDKSGKPTYEAAQALGLGEEWKGCFE